MAHLAQRLSRRAAVPIALLAAIVAWALWSERRADVTVAPVERSAAVGRQPFTATIDLAGTVVAGGSLDVTAPFDGALRDVRFTWGDQVAKGQVLAVLDTDDLRLATAEAEANYLKAAQDARMVGDWDRGTEVARARRTASGVEQDLAELDRRIGETRRLLDRGLVARNEVDALVSQRRGLAAQAAATREDVRAAIARGGPVERRIAAIARDTAARRLARARGQLDGAVVRAPSAGIVVRPPLGSAEQVGSVLHVGARLARGQPVASVARSDALAVTTLLDEADVTLLRVGQRAVVTGAGFPGVTLTGRVESVSGEAVAGAAEAGKARFGARIALDPLPPGARETVRIGMTASITVTTYENARALVVPPEAVVGAAPAASVRVRRGDAVLTRAITIGRVTPTGVEVLSGLRAGETVVWSPPPPDAAAPGSATPAPAAP